MKNKLLVLALVGFFLTGCEEQSSSTSPNAQTSVAVSMPKEQSAIGDNVVLSSDNSSQQKISLVSGWSVLESTGVWSDGQQAVLAIAAKNLPEHFKIALTYIGFTVEKHPKQSYEILNAQGKMLAQCDFSFNNSPKTVDIAINKSQDADADGNVVLTIKILDPMSPAKLGLSDDNRLLGMGLSKINILA